MGNKKNGNGNYEKQMFNLIRNFIENNKKIPTIKDFKDIEAYKEIFLNLSREEEEEINNIIDTFKKQYKEWGLKKFIENFDKIPTKEELLSHDMLKGFFENLSEKEINKTFNKIKEEKQFEKLNEFMNKYDEIPFIKELIKEYGTGYFNENDYYVINKFIEKYIVEEKKNKAGHMFEAFKNNNENIFWKFREMNNDKKNIDKKEFQEIGETIHIEYMKYITRLTQRMAGKYQKGMEKTEEAFDRLVYRIFPLFDQVNLDETYYN